MLSDHYQSLALYYKGSTNKAIFITPPELFPLTIEKNSAAPKSYLRFP